MVLLRVPTTTHFNKMCCCMVLWVLFRVPTTTHFNKVCCCMVLWVLFRVPTTTHFSKVCCCMVLFRVPTTTHFVKMCCCMVLWVLFRVPTTAHFNKVNGVVCRNTHNTIQQHILLKCVVVGTRNNTHNTVQQHISTKCVVVWCCGRCDPQHHSTTHFVKMCYCHCCGYSKQHPQQHTLLMLLLCVTYEPS